jgi:hypothetical protein
MNGFVIAAMSIGLTTASACEGRGSSVSALAGSRVALAWYNYAVQLDDGNDRCRMVGVSWW